MQTSRKTTLWMALAAFGVGAVAAMLYVREPTVPLTRELLASARGRWRGAGIHDYDLDYRMHGSSYSVRFRQGGVDEVRVNGQAPTSGDWNVYSVEGLFDTLEQELDNLDDPGGPFAGRGRTLAMRVRFNGALGHVEHYVRGGAGVVRGATIEAVHFRRAQP